MSEENELLASGTVVDWLVGTMRPRLDLLTTQLQRRFPAAQIHSYGGPVGSLTDFQALYAVGGGLIRTTSPGAGNAALGHHPTRLPSTATW